VEDTVVSCLWNGTGDVGASNRSMGRRLNGSQSSGDQCSLREVEDRGADDSESPTGVHTKNFEAIARCPDDIACFDIDEIDIEAQELTCFSRDRTVS
jgi:hypothetical protein